VKRPPKHAPARIASTANLRSFQRMMTAAVIRPLDGGGNLRSKWIDGRSMHKVAAEFIKPNDRLTSFDRLELYNQMYWYRLFEAIRDDCPALMATLGEKAFGRLAQAYLTQCPSRSFTLRDLCLRLVDFMRKNPRFTAPLSALAIDIARFEWAQTVAFDGESRPVLSTDYLARTPPSRLRLGLQPYVTLLDLRYPVDTYSMSVKRRKAMRSEASNTPDSQVVHKRSLRRAALPKPSRTFVAVHRLDNQLYYKRLEPEAFLILEALSRGITLSRAITVAGPKVRPAELKAWFASWMGLGWFCSRGNKRS
jgi:hypothetical protein